MLNARTLLHALDLLPSSIDHDRSRIPVYVSPEYFEASELHIIAHADGAYSLRIDTAQNLAHAAEGEPTEKQDSGGCFDIADDRGEDSPTDNVHDHEDTIPDNIAIPMIRKAIGLDEFGDEIFAPQPDPLDAETLQVIQQALYREKLAPGTKDTYRHNVHNAWAAITQMLENAPKPVPTEKQPMLPLMPREQLALLWALNNLTGSQWERSQEHGHETVLEALRQRLDRAVPPQEDEDC